MKIVKVTYTTSAEYSEQNKANIQQVMSDLQQINNPGIKYTCCVSPDDKTFTHYAFFQEEQLEKILFDLPAFQRFQQQLKASGPEAPPKSERLSLVGASHSIF